MKKILKIVVALLFVIGILGTGSLVIEEIQTGNGCPKIWIIPACVIILICFIIPLISHILGKYNKLYFFFTGLAAMIAIIASIMQFTGNGECPKTGGGIPMCYYSLLLFTGLIVLKIYQLKSDSSGN
ncbi:hypothetical protein SAMN04487910_3148 [Aquimarina amphilecti]|uniref:Uncharacterized protein n=1 Tax=Aquimarina amphilecti TaxID=1038014 RepID=A0A1H7SGH1_AQUAM|nr:hypothetical protein [Aquimarina amphilecti]SEL71449.1 hypothetical protein SAMN04487910_3148 [Aquimarina amphilecti]